MHHIDTNLQVSKFMKVTSSTQTDPISATLSENQLNTVDLLAAFFMKVYKKEIAANKINECSVLETFTKLTPAFGSNDRQRCGYLHFYATCHTLLVKGCITRFLKEYPKSEDLIKTWKSSLNISSLSFGPSLDCIAFILALLEVSQDPKKIFKVAAVLSANRWFKTVEVLSEVLQEVKTPLNIKYESEKVTLKTLFKPSKSKELLFLQRSNVLLIFQPFTSAEIKTFKRNVSELITKLRSGVLIFSIISSSQSSGMQSILRKHKGTFLYGPITVASDEFKVEMPGKSMKTVPSATFHFFVWGKDYDPFDYTGCPEKLLKPMIKSKGSVVHALNLGGPPKIISFLRNDLKKVNFFYSFNDDQIQDSDGSIGTQTDLVSEAVLENKLNTNRLVTDFFMEVFMSELAESKFNESSITFSNLSRLLFSPCGGFDDKARLGYMYRYATCHTLLMKECMVRFLKEYPEADKLLLKWKTNPNHCSLSLGPGLDYIAFNLAVLEVSHQNLPITQARIIRTHNCCWKSTFAVLSDVMHRVNTPLNLHFDAKLIQPNLKCKKWKPKTVKYLRSASVVFMFKTLHLTMKEPMKYSLELLKEMVSFMKPGNLIFFMDSALSSSMMREVLGSFSGTFLHGPTLVSCEELRLEVSEELVKSLMRLPAQSAEVEFFVWEKISNGLTPIKNIHIPDKASTSFQTSSKPIEKVEPESSDVKRSFLPVDTSSSDSGFTPNDQKQLKSNAKTKPVVSKTIMMLKELMESTNDSDGANTAENSCELGAQKLITAPSDGKTTSEHHSSRVNSAHTEIPKVSKPPSEMGPKKEILSDDQVGKINSLIARIDGLASSIEDDLSAPSRMSMSEGSVNVTEINLLTQKINNLITTLESNIGNQHQCSESRIHNCRCSCKMHVSPCQSNCDMTVKISKPVSNFGHYSDCVSLSGKTDFKSDERDIQHGRSSNCHIVPSQFLGHSVQACCVCQPSIVIPLENITPDMLSLILSCKK